MNIPEANPFFKDKMRYLGPLLSIGLTLLLMLFPFAHYTNTTFSGATGTDSDSFSFFRMMGPYEVDVEGFNATFNKSGLAIVAFLMFLFSAGFYLFGIYRAKKDFAEKGSINTNIFTLSLIFRILFSIFILILLMAGSFTDSGYEITEDSDVNYAPGLSGIAMVFMIVAAIIDYQGYIRFSKKKQ